MSLTPEIRPEPPETNTDLDEHEHTYRLFVRAVQVATIGAVVLVFMVYLYTA
ncbi:aa3-type cytochrome c oxidase subunit IV [Alsobacter sp. SYSU BS001988]